MMVNCSQQNNEKKVPLTVPLANSSKIQVADSLADSIRVRNALSHVSNGSSSQPPAPTNMILPQSAPGASPQLKRGRQKCDAGMKASVAPQLPGTVTVIVKNRFKHCSSFMSNGSPSKKQKTGLEQLSENYNESNSSTDLPTTSIVQSSGSTTVNLPNVTPASVTSQQRSAHLQPSPALQPATVGVSLCTACKSIDTQHCGNGIYKCRKCNWAYVPLNRFHPGTVQTAVTTAILPAATFYGSPSNSRTQPTSIAKKTSDTDGKRTRKNKQLETIDLVSSDEDEEHNTKNVSTGTETTQTQQSTPTVNSRIAERMKLPRGVKESIVQPHKSNPSSATSQDAPSSEYTFRCNKVMFGELYGQSVAPTRVVDNRMYLSLECLIVRENIQASEKYTLSVGSNDVEEICVYFGRIPSFIAIKTASKFASVACKRIGRNVLLPSSEEVKKRYIILALNSAFKNDNEADIERRNLITAVSPWAKVHVLSHAEATVLIDNVKLDVCQKEVSHGKTAKAQGPVETLLIYPPSLKSGGIPITTLDVACLDEGTYLNDVIIDFYLKYLYEDVLTKEQREKTYIFNSYFYKRLTLKSGSKFSPSVMHAQVKKWTRNVDIFQKDFIIIPVNEHCHWYLVVICFPSSKSKIEDFNEKEEEEEEEETSDFVMKEVEPSATKGENSPDTTSDIAEAPELAATPPPASAENSPETSSPKTQKPDAAISKSTEKDTGNKLTTETSAETTEEVNKSTATSPPKIASVVQTFKQATDLDAFVRPCILIFDSLVGSGHSRVFTNLRHYLTEEWTSRKPKESPRVFDKDNMKGCYPKIPRQNNDVDCGVFILQYAEFFFTKPVKNFRMPIHLERWFTVESVTRKRDEIKELINKLADDDDEKSSATVSTTAVATSNTTKSTN